MLKTNKNLQQNDEQITRNRRLYSVVPGKIAEYLTNQTARDKTLGFSLFLHPVSSHGENNLLQLLPMVVLRDLAQL